MSYLIHASYESVEDVSRRALQELVATNVAKQMTFSGRGGKLAFNSLLLKTVVYGKYCHDNWQKGLSFTWDVTVITTLTDPYILAYCIIIWRRSQDGVVQETSQVHCFVMVLVNASIVQPQEPAGDKAKIKSRKRCRKEHEKVDTHLKKYCLRSPCKSCHLKCTAKFTDDDRELIRSSTGNGHLENAAHGI